MGDLFRAIINTIAVVAIPFLLFVFLGWGIIKKVRVYEVFVEGAKEGFTTAVRIIPYLVAMLARLEFFVRAVRWNYSPRYWLLLPTLSACRPRPCRWLSCHLFRAADRLGIITELMKVHGPDSFIGILASTMYGSSETTFYVLAVYFGSVQIKNTRHAVPAGLIADLFGMSVPDLICRILFGV